MSTPSTPDATSDTFDLEAFDRFLAETCGLSESNRSAVMRVIRKLVSGEGVTHTNKPGAVFLPGHHLKMTDDLAAVRRDAIEFLPHTGPDRLDRGRGWALAHPLQKAIEFKAFLAGERVARPPRKRKDRPSAAASGAPVPNFPPTASLMEKVARIKAALAIDEALALPHTLAQANLMTGLLATGTLPAQADALLAAIGAA